MNIVNSFFTVVSHIKQWVPETYTLILFSLQKAPWPFRAVHVCLRIGLCTMENSTSWSIWSFCACLLYQMIRFDQLDDQKVCIVPTSATMNARMVQMLGLLWMKLVVPSEIEYASSVVILRDVLRNTKREESGWEENLSGRSPRLVALSARTWLRQLYFPRRWTLKEDLDQDLDSNLPKNKIWSSTFASCFGFKPNFETNSMLWNCIGFFIWLFDSWYEATLCWETFPSAPLSRPSQPVGQKSVDLKYLKYPKYRKWAKWAKCSNLLVCLSHQIVGRTFFRHLGLNVKDE